MTAQQDDHAGPEPHVAAEVTRLKLKGLQARQKIAQGKRRERKAQPWVINQNKIKPRRGERTGREVIMELTELEGILELQRKAYQLLL